MFLPPSSTLVQHLTPGRRPAAIALRGASGGPRAIAHALRQVLALDVIHREEVLAVVLPHFKNRHDARVVQIGRRLGLNTEALNFVSIGLLARQKHLERDDAIHRDLARFEDDAQAAFSAFVPKGPACSGTNDRSGSGPKMRW